MGSSVSVSSSGCDRNRKRKGIGLRLGFFPIGFLFSYLGSLFYVYIFLSTMASLTLEVSQFPILINGVNGAAPVLSKIESRVKYYYYTVMPPGNPSVRLTRTIDISEANYITRAVGKSKVPLS